MKTLVILGSVREKGNGVKVMKYLEKALPSLDCNTEFSFVYLKDMKLVHYAEPGSPRSNSNYVFEETRNWSMLVKQFDGYIFVTPEYNGFFTGALKDAIDLLYNEWVGKAAGIIGYGSRGAKRAVKQLSTLLKSFEMTQAETVIGIHQVWDAFNGDVFNTEKLEGNLQDLVIEMEKKEC